MLQEFVAKLHDMNMRYVVIIDPGIKAEKGYPAYEEGLAADIFVKDVTGAPYLGQVIFYSYSASLLLCFSCSNMMSCL